MRILLLGANGQVGTELQRDLDQLGALVWGSRGGDISDDVVKGADAGK